MRSTLATCVLSVSALFPFHATTVAGVASSAPPDWIAGYWLRCEDGARFSETWSGGGTGTLVGHGITHGPNGAAFEFLRIARDDAAGGRYAYFASPGGAVPVAFALTSEGAGRVVFENPNHDFPQRIVYERYGDTLNARVELIDGSKSMSWTYRRALHDEDCPAQAE